MSIEAEEEEQQQQSILTKLPLLSVAGIQSPERPGTVTPPLHTSAAAVPFRWEQVPGKPIPCSALIPLSSKSTTLELPPRLLVPSAANVLEAGYKFGSPSFRRNNVVSCYGTLVGTERKMLGAMVLTKEGGGFKFGSLRKNGFNKFKVKTKREVSHHVFPSSSSTEIVGVGDMVNMPNIKRSGSSKSDFHAKSRVWTNICEGLKQVVPWSSKKLKKEESGL